MARLGEFRDVEPADYFQRDRGFHSILTDLIQGESLPAVLSSLEDCARLVAGRWSDMANEASRPEQQPKIIKLDRLGNPVERCDFGPVTPRLRREAAEFGVLTRAESEVHKFALVYLLAHNGETSLTCPISCTDGLIRAIEAKGSDFLRERYLPLLRSSETPFAGAQFVTEQAGGSDVGAIETEARPNVDGSWSLSGEKWFCSNPDEFFAVAARPKGGRPGTDGVAMFLVPRRLPNGALNSISFKRLKDKLGTRSLPTAEIAFEGATGYAIGDVDEGFKTLMNYIINASRVHNAANACGFLHRAFIEARNYARQREAFGNPIITYPLVQETLVRLLDQLWRYRLLTFRLVSMIDEHGITPADAGQAIWQRFLINVAKYRTASTLTDSVREAIMVLGGNGIVEDFGVLPRLLRDSMIIETWEGTHNTLCIQVVRDAYRSDLLLRWQSEVTGALERWPRSFLSATRSRVDQTLRQTLAALSGDERESGRWKAANARRLVDRLATLLEIVWMADAAQRMVGQDASPALLTAIGSYYMLPNVNVFEHPALDLLAEHAQSLIDETPIYADVSRI